MCALRRLKKLFHIINQEDGAFFVSIWYFRYRLCKVADVNIMLEHYMNHHNLIMVVEDEQEIAEILTSYINKSAMKAVHAKDGETGMALFRLKKPDLILLDIQLPDITGWNFLTALRKESNIPVIMVTAFDQDIDKLMGLRLGADDYIIKPFNPLEVLARIEAVLRRVKSDEQPKNKPIRTQSITIYPDEFHVEIAIDGKIHSPDLTTSEFKLLAYMAKYPRRVFSREELMNSCLPEGDKLDRTIDSHISKLRKKLGKLGLNNVPESVRGIGYRLGNEI